MFNASFKCILALLSVAFIAVAKEESLPPTPGEYFIQNAASGFIILLASDLAAPGTPILERPLQVPLSTGSSVRQVWVLSAEGGNIGTLRILSPPSFLNCPSLTAGAVCSGNEEVISPFGITPVVGGFIIEPVQGLALTATGVSGGQVFLSPTTQALNQIWLFESLPPS